MHSRYDDRGDNQTVSGHCFRKRTERYFDACHRDTSGPCRTVSGPVQRATRFRICSTAYGVLRPDAELVTSYTYDKFIHADEGVTMPAYTTTSTTLKASASLTPTVSMDLTNYNYEVLIRTLSIPTYNVTTKAKGRVEYSFVSALYEVCEFPANTFHALIDPTKALTSRSTSIYAVGAGSRIIYYSSGTAIAAYASNAYGPNQTITAPAVSGTTLTLKSPALITRGHTTYYTNTYMNATTDIRYQYIIDVYRSPKNNLNLDGWGVYTQAEHIVDCVDNGGTLT